MLRSFFRILIAVALVASTLAGLPVLALAAWSPPTPTSSTWQADEQLAIPYVPNNETIAGTGPWHGVVQIANASNFPVTVDISDANGMLITSLNLAGNGSTAIAAATLFGTNPGGGLLLSGRETGGCAPQALQQFTVTRGLTPNTADVVTLPVPSGINVTDVSISQGTTWYAPSPPPPNPPNDYSWSQAGTNLNISWAPPTPPNAEPTGGSVYTVLVAYDFPCRPARISAAVKLVAPAPSVNARTSSS
ncbi:MAG: hypothetical protein RMK01_10925, partial [Thermomicrobium sp.]|nr:hypothetical protein [Thermomicrobium sp.]